MTGTESKLVAGPILVESLESFDFEISKRFTDLLMRPAVREARLRDPAKDRNCAPNRKRMQI